MNQGRKYNFIKIIQEKSLLIPQIQRDYIQHRTNYKVEKSRSQLLDALITVVKGEEENIILNFVYGYSDFIFSEDSYNGPLKRYDCFVPIDGQQRLTTLFLLHLFVYANENKNVDIFKNKLFYQTRATTQTFINKLTNEMPNLIENGKICENIKNSNWYSSSWEFDTSVKSCLKVLKEIQEKFNGFNNWSVAKSNLDNIGFMFLNITELGKPNELYIKMNSRGRQLTPFENFKSDLYGYIDKEFSNNPDFITNFKDGLDNDWQENIWNWLAEPELSKQYTDELTKEIIHWIIVSRKIIDHESDKESAITLQNLALPLEFGEKDCNMIYPKNATPEKYWFTSYNIEKGQLEIEDIYYAFNAFAKISKDLRHKLFNSLIGTIQDGKLNKNINQYPARIRLLSITLYATKAKESFDENNFKKWYRVINNLVNHSEIDTIDRFYIASKAVIKLSERYSSLLTDLENGDKNLYRDLKIFPNIKDEQINEEYYKARLMMNPEWKEVIEGAENHEYFKGEIYFALFDCTDSNIFQERWSKISEIFNDYKNDIALKKYFLQNPIENVFPYSISDKKCIYYWNDSHHNNDWRAFLRKQEGREAFKVFLTSFIESQEKLDHFVKNEEPQLINSNIINNDFRTCLINNDNMLSYMEKGRYIHENGHYYLLKFDDRSRGVDYKLFEAYLNLKEVQHAVILPEFTSKDDMSNMYLNVKGKKIIFDNGSFVIGDTRLNSEDVNVLKQEIEKAL